MTLHGLDVSHWQTGLQLAKTGKDFAIMKATDGSSYVDSTCNGFVNQAKSAGMLWGTYHFWQAGYSPTAQADHYIDSVAGYVGHGLLVLDWESSDTGNIAGAKAWLDRVYARTGVRAVVYMSQSVAAGHNWSSVSKNHALWVARYNDTIGSTGGWPVTIWQYTSSGRVNGYGGSVDLDHFYGDRAAWTALAAGEDSSSGSNTTDTGDDDMPAPQWRNTAYGTDYTVPGDGAWHVLTIGGEPSAKEYSYLAGPSRVTGTLNVSVTGLAKGVEAALRPVFVETKKGADTKVVQEFPAVQATSNGGTTQMALPFTQDIIAGENGWARRLRFQIRAGGGEKVTVTSTRVRGLYWDR